MGRKNQRGQIVIEFVVVMIFIVMIFFIGLAHLTTLKEENRKYQFSEKRNRHAK